MFVNRARASLLMTGDFFVLSYSLMANGGCVGDWFEQGRHKLRRTCSIDKHLLTNIKHQAGKKSPVISW